MLCLVVDGPDGSLEVPFVNKCLDVKTPPKVVRLDIRFDDGVCLLVQEEDVTVEAGAWWRATRVKRNHCLSSWLAAVTAVLVDHHPVQPIPVLTSNVYQKKLMMSLLYLIIILIRYVQSLERQVDHRNVKWLTLFLCFL